MCKVPGRQRKSRFHIESSGAHGTGHILTTCMISVKGILRKVSHIDYKSILIAISMTITIIQCVA